jgi:hypothetical protein
MASVMAIHTPPESKSSMRSSKMPPTVKISIKAF